MRSIPRGPRWYRQPRWLALLGVLILAVSSTCKQQWSNTVTCTGPAPGINEVVFHTYPSLTALYNAYMAEVMSLSWPDRPPVGRTGTNR
jgi:hypothetical protein